MTLSTDFGLGIGTFEFHSSMEPNPSILFGLASSSAVDVTGGSPAIVQLTGRQAPTRASASAANPFERFTRHTSGNLRSRFTYKWAKVTVLATRTVPARSSIA